MSGAICHSPACGTSRNTSSGKKGTLYAELRLGAPKWSDERLIDFMMAHPILINRVTPLGTRLCRPSEAVLGIVSNFDIGALHQEEGEVVLDPKSRPA